MASNQNTGSVVRKSGSVLGLVVFGTLTSLLSKIMYQVRGEDFEGHDKLFRKPWMSTTFMFIGMALCLPIVALVVALQKCIGKARHHGDGHPSSAEESLLGPSSVVAKPEHKSSAKEKLMLAIPMMFDLVATVLMCIGLLYVAASIYQMLRGAEMIFTALFSVLFLHRSLNKWHYWGVTGCLIGIIIVGLSSVLSANGDVTNVSAGQMLLGMALIVLAQGVQSAQVTTEDYYMSGIGVAPLQVVGYEGIFGSVFMICILLPIVQFLPGQDGSGIHENSLESLHMIFHPTSWALPTVIMIQIFGMLAYNVSGMFVTGDLGALTRTVLETMRTLFVWLVDLALYYSLNGNLGEPWDQWSWLQAFGFAVLVAGTLVYSHGDEEEHKVVKARKMGQRWHRAVSGHGHVHVRRHPHALKPSLNIFSATYTKLFAHHNDPEHGDGHPRLVESGPAESNGLTPAERAAPPLGQDQTDAGARIGQPTLS